MRYIIIAAFSFLLAGCISNSRVEQPYIEPRHKMCMAAADMASAESKAASLNYQGAIKDYMAIFKKYTDIRCRKKATLKVVDLNLHPNNPKINYSVALEWLQIYSGLGLTPEEEENVLILSALIRRINLIQDEKARLVSLIEKQKKKEMSLKKAVSACETKQAILEKELSSLKEKFQKIKEIDVQMHKSRKSKTTP